MARFDANATSQRHLGRRYVDVFSCEDLFFFSLSGRLTFFRAEMGLGKTLQTIALLAYLAAYKGIWGPHLVIVPTSVIVNWETELKRFAPGLKALCYYGTAKRRKELRTGWTKVRLNF